MSCPPSIMKIIFWKWRVYVCGISYRFRNSNPSAWIITQIYAHKNTSRYIMWQFRWSNSIWNITIESNFFMLVVLLIVFSKSLWGFRVIKSRWTSLRINTRRPRLITSKDYYAASERRITDSAQRLLARPSERLSQQLSIIKTTNNFHECLKAFLRYDRSAKMPKSSSWPISASRWRAKVSMRSGGRHTRYSHSR